MLSTCHLAQVTVLKHFDPQYPDVKHDVRERALLYMEIYFIKMIKADYFPITGPDPVEMLYYLFLIWGTT